MPNAERIAARAIESARAHLFGRVLFIGNVPMALQPLRCGLKGCARLAVLVDVHAPYMTDNNRCRAHLSAEVAAHAAKGGDVSEPEKTRGAAIA